MVKAVHRLSSEIRDLIRRMSLANPHWGAPRHSWRIDETWYARLASNSREVYGPAPEATFTNVADLSEEPYAGLGLCRFLCGATITFRLLLVFVILSHDRRRPIHFAVTANPTAEWDGPATPEAFPWDSAPRYLLRDRDGIYGRESPRSDGVAGPSRSPRGSEITLAESLRGAVDWIDSPRVLGPRHHF